jgi:hypothetical protein
MKCLKANLSLNPQLTELSVSSTGRNFAPRYVLCQVVYFKGLKHEHRCAVTMGYGHVAPLVLSLPESLGIIAF